eukprot:CAMPEP_0172477762 /NCGR_PEP_ID=MMETSP1066-20121228/1202_1 /TAXON_ID=671091 /ORGANISM="Coscinodiscus wailesii, Strain CCMP2513" /LENGTH=144 /DNA_ID=CAMNT_0013236629 /DNA_START=58 /DNA_END=492 /DNA_ORIENTATION=+
MSGLNIKFNLFILFVTTCSAAKFSPTLFKYGGIMKQGLGGAGDACRTTSIYQGDECEGEPMDEQSDPFFDGPGQDTVCDSDPEGGYYNDFYCAADGVHRTRYEDASCSGKGTASVWAKNYCIKGDGTSVRFSCAMNACPGVAEK